MSKHNYTQYSNNKKDKENKPVEEEVVIDVSEPVIEETIVEEPVINETPEIALVEETVETVALPEAVKGVVVNCTKLNVRANPNSDAEVVCVLDAASEIEIDVDKSINEWFYVCTAVGIEGYCMRKFVDASL